MELLHRRCCGLDVHKETVVACLRLVIDGKVINGRRSTNNPDGGPNGPGCGGGVAVGSRKVELKVGDVLIVPPGVIHGWADIPDHVDYLSFRPSHGVMKNGWVNPTIAAR